MLHADVAADESPDDPEEYYDHQLVGLSAEDPEGRSLGEVTDVLHGAQDLLQIRTPDGRDALVPFVAALVPEVDLAGRPRRRRRPARPGHAVPRRRRGRRVRIDVVTIFPE